MARARSLAVCTAALVLALAGRAAAGGGPENLFLVVNSASWASQTVANHFVALRKIPPLNVLYIDWTGGFESIDADTLRDKILGPALDAVERRGLRNQIDYLIFSSDFPYSIDLSNDFVGRYKFPETATPACSLSSAAYLYNLLYAKLPIIMDLRINHYMRDFPGREVEVPAHGFRSWYGWGNKGELLDAGGQPYLLSTVLAITSGRGNSVREALAYLERSAAADGTRPAGTVYFSRTADVRSTKRQPGFDSAARELKELGVKSAVISTPLPVGKADVAGLATGVADFSWPHSHSKILAGAICENLTSFGGKMVEGGSQTPLSEFLRYGAAGASGTIVEPMAIPEKFPWPSVQVHYARGCTLAEAFYQSVYSPAQLLIVGDPLCQPWADIPKVQVAGVAGGETVSGTLTIKASAKMAHGEIDHFELLVDGRNAASARHGEALTWDTTNETDGYHQLRVAAIAAGPIETRGGTIVPVKIDNLGLTAELSTVPADKVRWDEPLSVRAKAPGMKQIFVVHNGRPLGVISGEEGEVAVDPRALGLGPVMLHVLAIGGEGPRQRVAAEPVSLSIEPPRPIAALKDPPARLAPGLALKLPSDKIVTVQDTRDAGWLALLGVDQNQNFTAQGFFDAAETDMYQFQIWHYGQLKLTINGTSIYDSQQGNFRQKFVPVNLAAGRHRLTIAGRTASDVKLRILFGGAGTQSINGKTFRHQTR